MADTKRKRSKAANKASKTSGARSGADTRSIVLGVAAGFGAIAAIMAGFSALARRSARDGGHPAPDLAADAAPVGSQRAPEAFRPDPTAPVSESEREGLRPATGPGPSMTAMRGEMANQTGAANG